MPTGYSLATGANPFKGKKRSPFSIEHKRKISESTKGRAPWNKGKTTKPHSKRTKKIMSEKKKGSKHWNWQGGKTPETTKIRRSPEYKLWCRAVFIRDKFTCQKYGTCGGKLAAHHILNFSSYAELRFALDNGITLSDKAHNEFHKKYGKENNTQEQLEEFLNRKYV